MYNAASFDAFSAYFAEDTPVVAQNTKTHSELTAIPDALEKLVKPAYDINGMPLYLDQNGAIIEGIYLGIPNEIYHSLPAYSSSQLKTYALSPAHYESVYVNGNKKTMATKSLDIGTISHELILEPNEFDNRHFILHCEEDYAADLKSLKEIKDECIKLKLKATGNLFELTSRLKNEKKATKCFENRLLEQLEIELGAECFFEISEAVLNAKNTPNSKEILKYLTDKDTKLKNEPKKIPVHKDIYHQGLKAKTSVERNSTAKLLLENGLPEVSFFVKDPDTGLMLKCRTDWLSVTNNTVIPVDLKTARSANPVMAAYQFSDLRYDLQAVFYRHVIALSGLITPERAFPFVVVETGDVIICEVFELHESDWEETEKEFPKLMQSFNQSISNKTWSGYTKSGCSTIKLGRRKSSIFLD